MAFFDFEDNEVRNMGKSSSDVSELYADKVRKNWLRSSTPSEVLIDADLKDVAIQTNSTLNVRVVDSGEELSWTWAFEVVTQGNITQQRYHSILKIEKK